MKRKLNYTLISAFLLLLLMATACQKKYYYDSGLSKSEFNGTVMEYLESNPVIFDTLVQVIKLAGMESYFRDSSLTFFAPADSSIHLTIDYFNANLKGFGQDTIEVLSDVKKEVWGALLKSYMFKSIKGLEDYPQLDLDNKQAFPGEFSRSMGGRVMNIGAVFTDARGIKYQGLRYLNISYVPNEAAPYNSWILGRVATCNIKPRNGMVHVLQYASHYFGFDPGDAWQLARYYGFN
ncbi:hypothetical protein [Niabella beijingensis]|uniref:hypothetical protein n=1 Tax=Niabella beijingensis TaxID=2872700 RepID=UPI001CBD6CB3|nr:hypothetical protein [Niabella beijingensis]MBZ4191043.1 hypothetical protein [Niabella beijingensis]